MNSILFQRGVYPPEAFAPAKKYGLSMMVAKDAELGAYIGSVLAQISTWLGAGSLQKLVLVVTSAATQEGSVNRHSESLWGGCYIYKMLGTVIVRNRDLRPQMGNPYEKEGIWRYCVYEF